MISSRNPFRPCRIRGRNDLRNLQVRQRTGQDKAFDRQTLPLKSLRSLASKAVIIGHALLAASPLTGARTPNRPFVYSKLVHYVSWCYEMSWKLDSFDARLGAGSRQLRAPSRLFGCASCAPSRLFVPEPSIAGVVLCPVRLAFPGIPISKS